ncbi:MAG: hypothetical protein ABWY10_06725 [Tardiphaga sp.]
MFIQIGDLFAVMGLTAAAFRLKNITNDRALGSVPGSAAAGAVRVSGEH